MTNTTDMENYHTCFRPRISHMFVLRVKVQYTIIVIEFTLNLEGEEKLRVDWPLRHLALVMHTCNYQPQL